MEWRSKVTDHVNTRTGEISDRHVRPFAELMTLLDGGTAHAEASRALNDVVSAVRDLGQKGSITIAVEIAPLKGTRHQVVVSMRVTSKPPKTEPTAGMFFVDDDANLTRNDPRQLTLDGLRVIEPVADRVVGGEGDSK
jgi:hypothetical protein